MATLLWIIAGLLLAYGLVRIVGGELVVGLTLVALALLLGPGGVSAFT